MAPSVPSIEPTTAQAGNYWTWTRRFGDFPVADNWVLSYAIRGKSILEWVAGWVTDDGSQWTVAIPIASTKKLEAGRYVWTAYCELATKRYTAASGVLVVTPNLADAGATDQQTHAEKMVTLLRSEIEARVTGTGSSHAFYSIAGRSLQKISLAELRSMLASYEAQVYREQNPGRLGVPVEAHLARSGGGSGSFPQGYFQ